MRSLFGASLSAGCVETSGHTKQLTRIELELKSMTIIGVTAILPVTFGSREKDSRLYSYLPDLV